MAKALKSWLVPYRLTTRGTCVVEAATAEDAAEMVNSGDFEADNGEEREGWSAEGPARLDE